MKVEFFDCLASAGAELLCDIARPRLTPAKVQYGKTRSISKNIRTGHSVKLENSSTTTNIRLQIAELVNSPLDKVEELWVLRYQQGEYFHKHSDGDHRRATVLICLTTDYEGGEFVTNHTIFRPRTVGLGIIFHNLGTHESLRVTSGEKWVAVTWIKK